MNSDIQAVLFDFDGTFANTERAGIPITRRVLEDYTRIAAPEATQLVSSLDMRGKDFGQICGQLESFINAGRAMASQIQIPVEHLRLEKLRPAAHQALMQAELAPGIVSKLDDLQLSGLILAIASNSPRIRIQPVLEKHGLQHRIALSRIFSALEDTGGQFKPLPAIYRHSCAVIGIKPENVCAVEDSAAGMQAATDGNIGMRVGYIGLIDKQERLRAAHDLQQAGAHLIIEHMRDLLPKPPRAARSSPRF